MNQFLSAIKICYNTFLGLTKLSMASVADRMCRSGAVDLRADQELHSRELIERGLKLAADLRATNRAF